MEHNYDYFFLSLFLVLLSSKFLGEITRRVFKSSLVGEIIAGIILGPTVLGMVFPEFYQKTFNQDLFREFLHLFNGVGVVMLLLVAGMESDLGSILKQKVILFSAPLKIVVSMLVSFFVFYYLVDINYNKIDQSFFIISLGFMLAITALPVLVKILSDLNLYRTDVGMSLVGTAVFIDMIVWIGFSVVLIFYKKSNDANIFFIFLNIFLVILFLITVLTVIRKIVDKILPYIQSQFSWPEGILAFVFSLCFLFSTIAEFLGTHAIIGSFLSGLIISDSEHFRDKIHYRIESIVNSFFSPIYFGSLGLYLNFSDQIDFKLAILFVVLGVMISVISGFSPYKYFNKSTREAFGFGYGLSIRGATDIIFISLLLSLQFVNEKIFVSYVLAVVLVILISPTMLRIIFATRYNYRFYDYLTDKLFIKDLNADTDEKAIEQLCNVISDVYKLDFEDIKSIVIDRERLMPTGIGNGIAIPHGRVPGLVKPIIAVGISDIGIDFGSRDGTLAHLIFLILTPYDNPQIQLEILADIAKTFKYFEPNTIIGVKNLHQFISFVRNELQTK
ncbi:cation:proton antiporter [Calditerrivibrio nitroreducens]|uniref:Sodium/hydrogen exchanger n=1 Tax=Calditerrivibrio nitroreducens (strain DSM 19672 / NBRC 101217 / Yu37-1) TaxID=768670 RepID=E4TGM7_CALNY|nr:cation:proton antiporter [Calditerrivibrio nitroreducens]ADR19740.1 sodium/hydrogen exchanger [Calditerrivibrio nitroreducens DSM 19672]